MDGQSKRKRARDSDTVVSVKRRKREQDRLSVMDADGDPIGEVTEEHMDMLHSVKGHLKELKQVSDSTQDKDGHHKEKSLPKSDEKKLKKKSKKTVNSSSSDGPHSKDSLSPATTSKESAMEYLALWDTDKDKWSFKKKTQFWLLQNMYQKSMLPKTQFKVLLRYLVGLQGNQRQLVVERAQGILDQYSEEESDGSPTKREYKRAVAILRVLA